LSVALLLSAMQSTTPTLVPVFILALIASNLLLFFAFGIGKKQSQMFARTLPQTVLFLLLIVLIILGISASALRCRIVSALPCWGGVDQVIRTCQLDPESCSRRVEVRFYLNNIAQRS
jgi:hypothetical protein